MNEPIELSTALQNMNSPLFGATARWKKMNDQWVIALTGVSRGSQYSGEEVIVQSSKGAKKVVLGEKLSDWGSGSYYLPVRYDNRKTEL